MEMKEACLKLGKIFKRMSSRLDPFETYKMIVSLKLDEDWNSVASDKMKASLEQCKIKLEPFLSGSDGNGRTAADQAKTVERRNEKRLKMFPQVAEAYAMAKADIFCTTQKVKKSVEYNTIH